MCKGIGKFLISPTCNSFVILNPICLFSLVPSNFQRPSMRFIPGSSQGVLVQSHFQGRAAFKQQSNAPLFSPVIQN